MLLRKTMGLLLLGSWGLLQAGGAVAASADDYRWVWQQLESFRQAHPQLKSAHGGPCSFDFTRDVSAYSTSIAINLNSLSFQMGDRAFNYQDVTVKQRYPLIIEVINWDSDGYAMEKISHREFSLSEKSVAITVYPIRSGASPIERYECFTR